MGALPAAVLALALVPPTLSPRAVSDADNPDTPPPRGLLRSEPGAYPGYTLIAPLRSRTIYLVDMDGEVVHRWDTDFAPGSEYLMENGDLLRCAKEPDAPRFRTGGQGGRLQRITWDGTVIWDWTFVEDEYLQHHDIEVTPDGTVLFLAWEAKSPRAAIEAGRIPSSVGRSGLWPDFIVEIEPLPPDDADVLWEWHVWDHLIQDHDPDRENFGVVAEHPELIDINANVDREQLSGEQVQKLQALGYLTGNQSNDEGRADWLHTNAIDYHPDLDQIVVSVPHYNEVWVIDHSTTIDEATGHTGGQSGKGGDLLYRWGNPRMYGAGTPADQRLFYQHDARWIPAGLPGAGNLLIFNNGGGRKDGDYSSVIELELPTVEFAYQWEDGRPIGPLEPAWEYTAPEKGEFFSGFISGSQRLPNGNTLVCEGDKGRVFEVTPAGSIVWEYLSPHGLENQAPDGQPAPTHALFRATRIPADHPGLAGKSLHPIREER